MILVVVLRAILVTFFIFGETSASEILKTGDGTYEYITDGKSIKKVTFEFNMYTNPKRPELFANCMVVRDGYNAGDEGRYVTFKSVDIYCKNKHITFREPTETNVFGTFSVNSIDNSWAVFIPANDGAIPRFKILDKYGSLSSIEINSTFVAHEKPIYKNVNNTIVMKGKTVDGNRNWKHANLVINRDSSYVIVVLK